jgi:hypothetical protein
MLPCFLAVLTVSDWSVYPISYVYGVVVEASLSAAKILTSQGLLG